MQCCQTSLQVEELGKLGFLSLLFDLPSSHRSLKACSSLEYHFCLFLQQELQKSEGCLFSSFVIFIPISNPQSRNTQSSAKSDKAVPVSVCACVIIHALKKKHKIQTKTEHPPVLCSLFVFGGVYEWITSLTFYSALFHWIIFKSFFGRDTSILFYCLCHSPVVHLAPASHPDPTRG